MLFDDSSFFGGLTSKTNARVILNNTPHCTCILILTCYQCDKAFPTQKLLDYHNKCHEARKVRQDVEQDIIFKCHKCGLDFSGKINLRQHLRQHLEFKCESCYRFYPTQEQLDKHVLNHKIYRCDECDVSFTVKHKYNKHMKAFKHGGMKNFQCDKCDKSYSTMQHLGVHYVSKIYISEFIYTPFLPREFIVFIFRLHHTPWSATFTVQCAEKNSVQRTAWIGICEFTRENAPTDVIFVINGLHKVGIRVDTRELI